MTTTIPNKNLRQFVSDVFNDAITYFKFCLEDAEGSRDKLFARMVEKEFEFGRTAPDLFFDQSGEAFLTPEAADAVTQSLLNFYRTLDRKEFPLLSRRIMAALIQCHHAPCNCEREDDAELRPSLH